MAKKLFFLFAACLAMSAVQGQNWRKLRTTADAQFEAGNYAEAAKNYEASYQKKQKDELIYKAGEAYYILRDYRKAAEAYRNVKDKNDEFPLAGLKYARSLKQDGQYEQAIQAFKDFNQNYTGQGKAVLEEIIRTEIRGSELGQRLAGQPDPNVQVSHLTEGVNSEANEFAPLSFSNNVLYYSSTMGGKARIYRSQRQGAEWAKGSTPENFPVIQGDHFAHGSLSPDGSRFYFTICGSTGAFNNLSTRCEIYVIRRVSGAWSPPEKLPNTINLDGTTSTQPFVIQQGSQEYLYFASNRGGGRGGLDLWYSTREATDDSNGFSAPVNLGPTINTLGDEMTPFIDGTSGTLYFSSNGHASIGGFDIFRSQGSATSWSVPENAGPPLNSSSDDYYYAQKTDGTGAFFVSNRIVPGEKVSTQDDDIFETGAGGGGNNATLRPVLQASVFDRSTNQLLSNFTVSVFEVDGTQERPLYSRPFSGGAYSFDLPPGNTFRVEVSSPGYEAGSYVVTTNDPAVTNYGQSLFLDPASPGTPTVSNRPNTNRPADTNRPPANANPTKPAPASPASELLDSGAETYTSRGLAPTDNLEFTTNAPRFKGIYYKVQIVALRRYDPSTDKFDRVAPLGEALTTEFVTEKSLTRILVGPYFNEADARNALEQVHSTGFPKAFLVRYEDGQRYGRVNL